MPNTHTTLKSLFDDVADAIREKDGTSASIVADTFPDHIRAIPTGGDKGGDYNIVQTIDGDNCSLAITDANTFVLTTKTVTQNGTYNASADNADGYSQVTVDVSGGGVLKYYPQLFLSDDDYLVLRINTQDPFFVQASYEKPILFYARIDAPSDRIYMHSGMWDTIYTEEFYNPSYVLNICYTLYTYRFRAGAQVQPTVTTFTSDDSIEIKLDGEYKLTEGGISQVKECYFYQY